MAAMAGIHVGDKLPEATLRRFTAEGPQEIQSSEFFKGRKVVLFAVPGAFTPTCNNEHMPSFLELADRIKAKGVDEVVCVAINDVFVLDAWDKSLGAAGRVTLLSDGNAEFSAAIGMTFDGSGFGLGTRSLRYAMVVDDGTVTAMQVEENPGVCTVSSGASILEAL